MAKPWPIRHVDLVDSSGTRLATNDDSRETQKSEIIGTTVPPSDDHEAAIIVTVAPGAYAAFVRSKE